MLHVAFRVLQARPIGLRGVVHISQHIRCGGRHFVCSHVAAMVQVVAGIR